MSGGVWSTTTPPRRTGIYFNFVAAVSAAVAPGPQGVAGIIGTNNWGPANTVVPTTSQGQFEKEYGVDKEHTLHDAALAEFEGMDQGGATTVLAYRAVGSAGAQATCILKDAGAVASLKLTAKYPGSRPSTWTVTVRTNAVNPSNKDLLLYEKGVLLEQYLNIEGGTSVAFAAAINAAVTAKQEPYLASATVEGASKTLANVVGVEGGAGSFGAGSGGIAGNDGATLAAEDYTKAFKGFEQLQFDVLALANITDYTAGDSPTADAFAAFMAEYNLHSGMRAFGLVGGPEGETLGAAAQRSYNPGEPTKGNYNSPDIVNLGVTSLKRLSDGTVFTTAQLGPRVAGAIANMGIRRALTGITLTGYQVLTSQTNATYEEALEKGVTMFENISTTAVMVSKGLTALVNIATSPYVNDTIAHQNVRNVAIDHFIQNQLRLANVSAIGQLISTETGIKSFIGQVLEFLHALEKQSVLDPESTVELDSKYLSIGGAMFLKLGIDYTEAVERFFFTVAVQ